MTDLAQQPLLTPFRMGELLLPNRIVMAPLTRQSAANSGHVPALLQAQYYAQRASAGVIISEGTAISPEGYGWVVTPGLWSEEQVSGWRVVTDAVHEAMGGSLRSSGIPAPFPIQICSTARCRYPLLM